MSRGRKAELPRVKTHFATNGDVLYEVDVNLGEGKRGVAKWRAPWPRPEYLGLFERSEAGAELAIPRNQRGPFQKERELARVAVSHESLWHPFRTYVQRASPCRVHPCDVRCLAEQHRLPIPQGLKPAKGPRARKAKRRP